MNILYIHISDANYYFYLIQAIHRAYLYPTQVFELSVDLIHTIKLLIRFLKPSQTSNHPL